MYLKRFTASATCSGDVIQSTWSTIFLKSKQQSLILLLQHREKKKHSILKSILVQTKCNFSFSPTPYIGSIKLHIRKANTNSQDKNLSSLITLWTLLKLKTFSIWANAWWLSRLENWRYIPLRRYIDVLLAEFSSSWSILQILLL